VAHQVRVGPGNFCRAAQQSGLLGSAKARFGRAIRAHTELMAQLFSLLDFKANFYFFSLADRHIAFCRGNANGLG
jgi:hypothetical protein